MKKSLLFLLLIIILPSVTATITLEGPSNSVYNVGDTAGLSGVITTTKDIFGQFKIDLQCQNTLQLFAKLVNIKKNQKMTFNEQLPLPLYFEKPCTFQATLTENNINIDQASSKTFTISKELKGTITADKQQAQLGETITITGTAYKLDGTNINGQATIYYKQEETIYSVETTPITEGTYTYEKDTTAQPPGTYTIHVVAQDQLGNQGTFTTENIILTNSLTITHNINNDHIKPGKSITIKGTATAQGQNINEGIVTITTDDITKETTITKGNYETSITIPEEATTGEHTLTITGKDTYENIGTATATYTVEGIPTTLTFTLEEGTFEPEQTFTYEAKTLDQGGALYTEDIVIIIIDPKGNEVGQNTLVSGEQQTYTLPQQAQPGSWKITAKNSVEKQEKKFYIKEIKQLDYQLEGNTIIITNIGNVPYKEPVKVTLQGYEQPINIVKDINLAVGESETINLKTGTPTGAYSVNVGDKTFNGVNIEGQPRKDYSWVYYAILALLVFVLLYFIMSKSNNTRTTPRKYETGPGNDNDFLDQQFQQRIEQDLERGRMRPTPLKQRTEHYPQLQADDLNRFQSHSEKTIFSKRRAAIKKKEEQTPFGGMFD
ncbi:MAG: hypothetical protein Q7R56_03405 [Nanoarchaeota archaeon]|nr:hypothetical protein [Nanoarchaeota archaeon]